MHKSIYPNFHDFLRNMSFLAPLGSYIKECDIIYARSYFTSDINYHISIVILRKKEAELARKDIDLGLQGSIYRKYYEF